jgi:HmuY protein
MVSAQSLLKVIFKSPSRELKINFKSSIDRTMMKHALLITLLAAACGGSDDNPAVDAATPDSSDGCDPATKLPNAYRPISMVSTGAVAITATGATMAGTIDATAGGTSSSADRPYIYVDLKTGTRVDVDDLAARSSTAWDIMLKRSSVRSNGGDSGPGKRTIAVVQGTSLDTITAPASGYTSDDFTTADCMLDVIPGGEPKSAFGEWYNYDQTTHAVSPKAEAYIVERMDGSRTAFRVATYYGDTAMPMRGAFYSVEWKQLPNK